MWVCLLSRYGLHATGPRCFERARTIRGGKYIILYAGSRWTLQACSLAKYVPAFNETGGTSRMVGIHHLRMPNALRLNVTGANGVGQTKTKAALDLSSVPSQSVRHVLLTTLPGLNPAQAQATLRHEPPAPYTHTYTHCARGCVCPHAGGTSHRFGPSYVTRRALQPIWARLLARPSSFPRRWPSHDRTSPRRRRRHTYASCQRCRMRLVQIASRRCRALLLSGVRGS